MLKFKTKKERELRFQKLESFLYNLTQMVMINPELAYDPQIEMIIKNSRDEVEKIGKKIEVAKKYEDNSDFSLSDDEANESMFSNDEDREEYLKIKKELKERQKQEEEEATRKQV